MSGETEREESGWTTDTLRYALTQRIDDLEKKLDERQVAQEKAMSAALAAAEKAVDKANEANEKRFESVNEFRKTLSDQTAGFITRAEYDAAHDALEALVTALTNRVNLTQGNTLGKNQMWGYFAGGIGVLVGVIIAANVLLR